MKFDQVQINKVNNGYLLNGTKIDILSKKQDNEILIFKDFDEVLAYLKDGK
jgi:hypothetical protein